MKKLFLFLIIFSLFVSNVFASSNFVNTAFVITAPEGTEYTEKTIIIDIEDNWGYEFQIGIRSLEMYLDDTLVTDWGTCYATSHSSTSYTPNRMFQTYLSKTGQASSNEWQSLSLAGNNVNQRVISVATTTRTWNRLVINNSHAYGASTNKGAKNIKIYVTSEEYTDTTYGNTVTNGTLVFDGQLSEHIASDAVDNQELTLE
jgi:hypothetical protein